MSTFVAARPRSDRWIVFVRWVRKTHGWFGLWGALLGLIAGLSGIWLNHRAVMKIELPDQQQVNTRIALPDPVPATAEAMAAWLRMELKANGPPFNQRVERARPAPWVENPRPAGADAPRSPMQPERWTFNFGGPNKIFQVEYWAGNKSASLRTTTNGVIATLTNLHKGTGMPAAWILLIDTLAGSLILLSISGVILWIDTNRRRLIGLSILAVAVTVTVALGLSPFQL